MTMTPLSGWKLTIIAFFYDRFRVVCQNYVSQCPDRVPTGSQLREKIIRLIPTDIARYLARERHRELSWETFY